VGILAVASLLAWFVLSRHHRQQKRERMRKSEWAMRIVNPQNWRGEDEHAKVESAMKSSPEAKSDA